MSSPLALVRPLRPETVGSVLVVQSGLADHLRWIVERVQRRFPGASITVLVREADLDCRATLGGASVECFRYGEYGATVRRLRQQRFDVAVVQIGATGHGELKLLPAWLRVRHVHAYDLRLNDVPIHVRDLAALARHLGGSGGGVLRSAGHVVSRALRTLAEFPIRVVFLIAAASWIHLRGFWRRVARRLRGQTDASLRASPG